MTDRNEFIKKNLPLVHSLANRFRGRGIEYEELFSAGSVGLVKAVNNFDESRGLCFSTYAVPVIMGEIRRLFRDGGSVKVSRGLKELSIKVTAVKDRLIKQGKEPHISDIAAVLGVSAEEVTQALEVSLPPVSLTVSDGEDGDEFDIPIAAPEERVTDILALKQSLGRLEPLDRQLLILRYWGDKTQTEIAQLLGMSQVQVSRREKKLLEELRKQLI